jgi:cellulose synthase/poly-beta-1,6-N-acetylglucosamine synthase-like glycosyltransferase
MICFLTWLSIISILYAYFGYPAILNFLPKKEPFTPPETPKHPYFSIIVTARNEESGIEKKIKNCIELKKHYESKAKGNAEVIIASDASEDKTDQILKSWSDKGVRLVRSDERGGKEKAQKMAATQAEGEIVFFTDVRAELDKDALVKFSNYFQDPTVGAVSTNDVVVQSEEGGSGEGFYVKYEMWLRKLESEFCSLIGLSGSGFAVKREFCLEMQVDICSDFALLLQTRKAGLRGVQADDIECRYHAVKTEEQEFSRKVRTVLRGIATFFKGWDSSLISRDPVFVWQLLSHKIGRWLVPINMIIASIGILILATCSWFYQLMTLLMLAFYGLAALGYSKKEFRDKIFVKIPLFFIITNLAILVAWIKFAKGERSVVWSPSVRPKS